MRSMDAAAVSKGSRPLATLKTVAEVVIAAWGDADPLAPDLVEDGCAVLAGVFVADGDRMAGKARRRWLVVLQRVRHSVAVEEQSRLEPMFKQVSDAIAGQLTRVFPTTAEAAAHAALTRSQAAAQAEAAVQALLTEETETATSSAAEGAAPVAAFQQQEGKRAQKKAGQKAAAAADAIVTLGQPASNTSADPAAVAGATTDAAASQQQDSKKAQKRARRRAAKAAAASVASQPAETACDNTVNNSK